MHINGATKVLEDFLQSLRSDLFCVKFDPSTSSLVAVGRMLKQSKREIVCGCQEKSDARNIKTIVFP